MIASRSTRPLRVLVVFEFGQESGDWMTDSLISALGAETEGLVVSRVHGIFPGYRQGGLHPQRIANLVWVYLGSALALCLRHYDLVLVRTSPPGVQIWCAAWSAVRGSPCACWLMDYHPEIEARALESRGLGAFARLLRALDARAMVRFAGIVVPDRAMATLARARAPRAEVLEHPTWGADGSAAPEPVSYTPGARRGVVRLAYSGNLGRTHDLVPLASLLRALAGRAKVELYVGASAEGNRRFGALGSELGIPVFERQGRVPLPELLALYNEWRIDLGVVLLSDAAAGLVSPSKFSGYINFGIPLLYIGPADTNAADICSLLHGGFRMANRATPAEIGALAEALLDPARMGAAARGAREAAAHFSRLDQRSLAALLTPRIRDWATA